MKIKLSKRNWEEMGKKAGWMKVSRILDPNVCPNCENIVIPSDLQVIEDGQKWHKICYDADKRANALADEQARDYDPQV